MKNFLKRFTVFLPTLFFALLGFARPSSAVEARPFGSHTFHYAKGSILPSSVSQAEMDKVVAAYYDKWKQKYIRQGCGPGLYYTYTEGAQHKDAVTVPEGMGYGMMITAYMAGHDPKAQVYFDGMFRLIRKYHCAASPDLMASELDSDDGGQTCEIRKDGHDTATDGDIDMAFALLLADKQWGSAGAIHYDQEALRTLNALLANDIDKGATYPLLGNWVEGEEKFLDSTRSSDFILDHFRSFAYAMGDSRWSHLLNSLYKLLDILQKNYSPQAGLVPDFIVHPNAKPAPASGGFLEGPGDGKVAYNGCRNPWRWATDFLISGDVRAKKAVQKVEAWIQAATGGDPENIKDGYELSGKVSPEGQGPDMAFVAPLGVGAMVDASNQAWLNAVWDKTARSNPQEGYFGSTIALMDLIIMSNNWWEPLYNKPILNAGK